MENIGVIGAGAMGKGIAKNLQLAGYTVLVYKRKIDEDNATIQYLRSYDITLTESMDAVFNQSDILVTCLPDSPTAEQVILGDLVHCPTRRVRCVLDFTTALPASTQKIERILADMQIEMLDTPMTGGPKQADEGALNLIIGGKKEVLEKHRTLLESISAKIVYAGDSGNGNAIKLANNFLSILNRAASAGVAILMKDLGVSLDPVYEFISASGGNSNGFRTMVTRILNHDDSVSFALNLAYKDLRYAKELFTGVGGFPIMDALVEAYKKADERGYGEQDVGAIFYSLTEEMNS